MTDPTWVQDACCQWEQRIGRVTFGRMGKALKSLVDDHGYEQVGAWLQTYLQLAPAQRRDGTIASADEADEVFMANARFCTPEAFVATYQVWKRMSTP
jgi:hypothetical protein